MARKILTAAKQWAYGEKTAFLVQLALRPEGVSGKEITERLGWAGGSAGWRVGSLADARGLKMSDRIYRDDGTIGYRLLAPTKSTAHNGVKIAAPVAVTKAPRKPVAPAPVVVTKAPRKPVAAPVAVATKIGKAPRKAAAVVTYAKAPRKPGK
jgi:hypothetical protein